MNIEEIKQINSLIILALKQTDSKLIKKIINNIIKVIQRNDLEKELRQEIGMLMTQENMIAGLNKLQIKLREIIAKESVTIKKYYSNILVTQKSFEQIEEAITDKRIRTKIKYILENKEIRNKYTQSIETSDLSCVKYTITNGIIIRILYFIEKDIIKICGFYTNHEIYMRDIASNNYYKANFKNLRWLPLQEL